MRKRVGIFIIAIFLLGTIVGASETYSKNITAWFYDIKINLDGSALTFSNAPFVYNGQTYVSLNELTEDMGYEVSWNDNTKTMNISSTDNNEFVLNTLRYQLDQKNLELNNLKYQLSQKEAKLALLEDDHYKNDDDSSDDLDDLEELFEDDYDRYSYYGSSLYFDNYKVTQLSNDDIKIRMYGDFDRNSSDWRNRRESDFRDFILDICKEVDDEFNEDVLVIVYDEDNDTIGEYEYDDSRNKIVDYDEYR